MAFACPRGEKALVVQWDEGDGSPPPALYSGLRVGDLIHDENGYRALESFVVTAGGGRWLPSAPTETAMGRFLSA